MSVARLHHFMAIMYQGAKYIFDQTELYESMLNQALKSPLGLTNQINDYLT